MVSRLAVEVKVSWAENSHTLRAEGADSSGTEKFTIVPQRGALLRVEGAAADAPRRWGRETDQGVPTEGWGGGEEEQKEEVCWVAL